MSTFEYSGALVDFSTRLGQSAVVAASPAAAAETVIATLNPSTVPPLASGVRLNGWAAFTIGASGVSSQLRIRQTSVAGTIVADSGAVTRTAANLAEQSVTGFDAAPPAGRVYVLTLQIASGAAPSTVSALLLDGLQV